MLADFLPRRFAMKFCIQHVLLAALLSPLAAQTVDTLGGITTAPTGGNRGKASLFRVDSSVLLLQYEMYFNIPGIETLTWFIHRYHSRSGTFTLEWTTNVAVDGTGVGPAWYSTGPVAVPLIEGNHYVLGAYWPGSLTYYYSTGVTNTPVSFGSWQRALTITGSVPATIAVAAGVDVAVYRQQLTTVPLPAVNIVGTGCTSGALVPRLVASGMFSVGTTRSLDLVDAAPNALGVYAVALGPTSPVPVPLFGCSVWLNLGGSVITIAVITSAAGIANLSLSIPPDPSYYGMQLSAQAGVLAAAIDITAALDLQVN